MSDRELTHLNESGEVHMVDVGDKPSTRRRAVAEGFVAMSPDLVEKFFQGGLAKGDAAAVARIAGITGAKKTSDLIPLCHPITLSSVEVSLEPGGHGVVIIATVSTTGQTGVEMEAMTAVSTAALAIYDMVKGVERGVTIESVRLREKEGGRTGTWKRPEVVD
ncbi:MAG TPA: cyclic pyranopterin monophosphate synthase MoaC [Acidimicrobiia bacterium]|jgi:cyclic pyranopterin phosphate synthase|nr:cyclic pyranopterin monophosphate synthase MoaC [Acidimicrobiia bacterium]